MRFATKIWLPTGLAMIVGIVVVASVTYQTSKSALQSQFLDHYVAVEQSISGTLVQVEAAIDLAIQNALRVYEALDAAGIDLDDDSLQDLANSLGVHALGYFDAHTGFVEKISGWPDGRGTLNFYDLCPSYRKFYEQEHPAVTTPFSANVVPTALGYDTEKYVYMASADKQKILGASMRSQRMTDLLREAIRSDRHIISIAMYAPNGQELAMVQGPDREAAQQSLPSFHQGEGISFYEDTAILTLTSVPSVSECCECTHKGLTHRPSEYKYRLSMTVSTAPLQIWVQTAKRSAVWLSVTACFGALVTTRVLANRLVRRLVSISGVARDIVKTRDLSIQVAEATKGDEINDLAVAFNSMLRDVREGEAVRVEAESSRSIAKVATQVAHDIRSPLAALNVALADMSRPSEETRLMMRNAIFRIQDIANHLLSSRKRIFEHEQESVQQVFLSSLVEAVMSEKRTQFRSRIGVTIQASLDPGSFGAFVNVNRVELMRVLSNLINNSVEAITDSGAVSLSILLSQNQVRIIITDSGAGMPAELVERLGQTSNVSTKESGNGLGTYHARQTVEKWAGTIAFASRIGEGTTVTICLPRARNPQWFADELSIVGIHEVIVVDDDVSIHGIWGERISGRNANNVKLVHLSTPQGLRDYVAAAPTLDKRLFLVDQEFLGSTETGLQIISDLSLASRAILVTSRADEEELLGRCEATKIKVLPKSVAAHVPIVVSGKITIPDVVLIDNDRLVHQAWRLVARDRGITLHTFDDPNAFLVVAHQYPTTLPIYIDSKLDHQVLGEDVSYALFERGFSCLYLATGVAPDEFSAMPWLRAIVGKEAPF